EFLEARQRRRNLVTADLETGELVCSGLISDCLGDNACLDSSDGHRRTGKQSPATIGDSPSKAGIDGLTVGVERKQNCQNHTHRKFLRKVPHHISPRIFVSASVRTRSLNAWL